MNRRRYVGGPWKTVVYHRYPKLSLVCDVGSHFIIACQTARGPKVDITEFQPLVTEALARARLSQLAADAGYDSEANHRFAREACRFDLAAHRSRVQVETVMSMIKRRLEAFIRGRTAWSQRRELRLKVLTHNVMILF